MPKKIRRPRTKKSNETTSALNRRALLAKIGAGLAVTATASALDLKMSKTAGQKGTLIGNDGGRIMDLSNGSITYDPTKVRVDCERGQVTFNCIKGGRTPTPTPK